MAYEKSKVSSFGSGSLSSQPPLVGFEYCHQFSRTPGEVPDASTLAEGEMAVNLADGVIYIKGADGVVRPASDFADAPADGGTYAREDGEWVDVAQAANLQLRRGTEAERVQITPLEGEPIYTTDSKKLYIGDGSAVGGNEIVSGEKAPQLNPKGMARLVTVRNSGNFTASVGTSTGYMAVLWWDGSVQVYGSGSVGSSYQISKAIPTTGNWIKSSPKEIFIWSCTSGNANQSGDLTRLIFNGGSITSLDVSGLTSLMWLYCTSNLLTSLDVSGLSSLTSLDCSTNFLSRLDVSGCPSLETLSCVGNSIASLDVSGLASLTDLACGDNSLTSLNVSGCTALRNLYCLNNSLASLDVSGCTELMQLVCDNNLLTSLRVLGISPAGSKWSAGITASNNQLSATALNQMYADLAGPVSPDTYAPYHIYVTNNPGTTSDDPTIATAKGYTVFGS